MLEAQFRQTATTVLKYAIRLAPRDSREWGQAMMSELHYVESDWEGTLWALGGSSVLAKQALVSVVLPAGHGYVPDGGLFAKSASVRRAALSMGAACVLVSILFFASPPFRQAFDVALRPWHSSHPVASPDLQPALAALAERAESRADAEGLAFCAVRSEERAASVRWAEEAVRRDPNLVWVFAVVAMRNPGLPQAGAWLERIEQRDPQNALVFMIEAESVAAGSAGLPAASPASPERERAWQKAMAAAFHSTNFDDYLDRVVQLNRQVVARYRFYNPYEVESRERIDLPPKVFADSTRYAAVLLQTGADLEASGDRKGARTQYWTVAHFGQSIDARGHTELEHKLAASLQFMACRQLQASFTREGNRPEAALFADLAGKFAPVKSERADGAPPPASFGRDISERNAAVVQISGLMIIVFSALALIATLILIAGNRRGARLAARRARPVATIVILASAVGLLFSAITLYLTYRPYWYIFQSAIRSGDRLPAGDFRDFVNYTPAFSGVLPRTYHVFLNALLYSGAPGFLFYVWAGVTLLGLIGLALILLRRLRGPPRVDPP